MKKLLLALVVVVVACQPVQQPGVGSVATPPQGGAISSVTLLEPSTELVFPEQDYTIYSATMGGATLTIHVVAGGGCEEHTFSLRSIPGDGKFTVYVEHDDRGDTCEGIIEKNVSFDISSLVDYAQAEWQTDEFVIDIIGFGTISASRAYEYVWLEKQITQCAEEWQEAIDHTLPLADQLREFYAERNIEVRGLQVVQLPPSIQCAACTCASNKVVQLETNDPGYFKERGFGSRKQQLVIGDVRKSSDPYTIDAANLEGTTLMLGISYPGGCEVHSFSLVSEGVFAESAPPEINIRLVHDDPGDPCDSIAAEELVFDIQSLIDMHNQAYGSGDFTVNLLDAEKMIVQEFTLP